MAFGGSATSYSFVHAADLHLDTPFKGVGQTNPYVAEQLREASLAAFDDLVGLCLQRDAAFLVLSGDVYDGAERGIRAQLRLREGLGRLSRAGIAVFIAHGNHDPIDGGWTAISEWPLLVTVFGSTEVQAVPVVRDGEILATVQGISYGRRDVTENLALRFSRPAGQELQVGVLHCHVTGTGEAHNRYSPCSLDDLQSRGLDYWALGHIHTRQVLAGNPHGEESWVVYPGNLQGRSPRLSERGAKGALVVTVEDNRVAGVEFVACDRVRFAEVSVDGSDVSSLEDLRDDLVESARRELATAEGRSVILQTRLVGASPIHHRLRARVLEELLTSLRDDFSDRVPWLWWSAIQDSTTPAIDLDEIRRGSDFAADLMGVADDVGSKCQSRSRDLDESSDAGEVLPGEFLQPLLASLPRALRERARSLAGRELLGAGLSTALIEIGAGEPVGAR